MSIAPAILAILPSFAAGSPDIVVTGTFTAPAWDFVVPSPDIGGTGVTAAEFAIAPTGWWLLGNIADNEADYSGVETLTTVNITGIIGSVIFQAKTEAVFTSLNLTGVLVISGDVNVTGMPAMESFNVSTLQSIFGRLIILVNPVLTSVVINSLRTVSLFLQIIANSLLPSLDCGSLETVLGNFQIVANPDLSSLTLTSLERLGTNLFDDFSVSENSSLVAFTSPPFLMVIGNAVLNDSSFNQATVDSLLVTFASLDGTGGTTSWNSLDFDISGGTNAAPGASGLTAKATLLLRSNTVETN